MNAPLARECIEVIEGLADQQAMPDDFYKPTLARLRGELEDANPSEVATAIFVNKQIHSSIMSGDYGTESWYDFQRELYPGGSSMGGPSLWKLLGHPLGDDALARVTVEVLDEGKAVKDTNPWKDK